VSKQVRRSRIVVLEARVKVKTDFMEDLIRNAIKAMIGAIITYAPDVESHIRILDAKTFEEIKKDEQ
jgi:hypothetical protein